MIDQIYLCLVEATVVSDNIKSKSYDLYVEIKCESSKGKSLKGALKSSTYKKCDDQNQPKWWEDFIITPPPEAICLSFKVIHSKFGSNDTIGEGKVDFTKIPVGVQCNNWIDITNKKGVAAGKIHVRSLSSNPKTLNSLVSVPYFCNKLPRFRLIMGRLSFYSGEKVSGAIFCTVGKPTQIRWIKLLVVGKQRSFSTGLREPGLDGSKGDCGIFVMDASLTSGVEEYQSGSYLFPFTFVLPQQIPPSGIVAQSSTIYSITASLLDSNYYQCEQEIDVEVGYNNAWIQKLKPPSTVNDNKISITISINNTPKVTVFFPGQTINFSVIVVNNSKKKVLNTKFYIEHEYVLYGRGTVGVGKASKKVNLWSDYNKDEIRKEASKSFVFSYTLPLDVAYSLDPSYSPIIHSKYSIRVECVTGVIGSKTKASLPFIIGRAPRFSLNQITKPPPVADGDPLTMKYGKLDNFYLPVTLGDNTNYTPVGVTQTNQNVNYGIKLVDCTNISYTTNVGGPDVVNRTHLKNFVGYEGSDKFSGAVIDVDDTRKDPTAPTTTIAIGSRSPVSSGATSTSTGWTPITSVTSPSTASPSTASPSVVSPSVVTPSVVSPSVVAPSVVSPYTPSTSPYTTTSPYDSNYNTLSFNHPPPGYSDDDASSQSSSSARNSVIGISPYGGMAQPNPTSPTTNINANVLISSTADDDSGTLSDSLTDTDDDLPSHIIITERRTIPTYRYSLPPMMPVGVDPTQQHPQQPILPFIPYVPGPGVNNSDPNQPTPTSHNPFLPPTTPHTINADSISKSRSNSTSTSTSTPTSTSTSTPIHATPTQSNPPSRPGSVQYTSTHPTSTPPYNSVNPFLPYPPPVYPPNNTDSNQSKSRSSSISTPVNTNLTVTTDTTTPSVTADSSTTSTQTTTIQNPSVAIDPNSQGGSVAAVHQSLHIVGDTSTSQNTPSAVLPSISTDSSAQNAHVATTPIATSQDNPADLIVPSSSTNSVDPGSSVVNVNFGVAPDSSHIAMATASVPPDPPVVHVPTDQNSTTPNTPPPVDLPITPVVMTQDAPLVSSPQDNTPVVAVTQNAPVTTAIPSDPTVVSSSTAPVQNTEDASVNLSPPILPNTNTNTPPPTSTSTAESPLPASDPSPSS
eukprot:TRINITY_DN3432_c0_g1_i1.p1 TRINITY_DN3432_c0_g1~~TRINITY_DN3432_c0_g1_i1.p1  ORF type:complete len:1132 (-),score=298.76 TRINITY_DN3432_c0_g1_i1:135-3530(-)